MYNEKVTSFRQQHHERPERPIGEVTLTQVEIERLKKDFAWSYKCDEGNISYHFEKIYDVEDGTFSLEFANLVFSMKTTRALYPPLDGIVKNIRKPIGTEVVTKEIYRIKIMLPAEVRQKLASTSGGSKKVEKENGVFAFD